MKTGTMIKNVFLYASAFFLIWTGCKKEEHYLKPDDAKNNGKGGGGTNYQYVPCGKTYTNYLKTTGNDSTGNVNVSNDSVNLSVTFKAASGFLLGSTSLYVGSCDGIERDDNNIPIVSTFPYNTIHSPELASFTYTIPLKSIKDSCFCILAYSKAVKTGIVLESVNFYESWANISGNGIIEPFTYCKQTCKKGGSSSDTCAIKAGDFRTQTQGGWGSTPHGNNPGTYLHKNFAGAFPNGLSVGCTYTLKLTTAQAVTDYLSGGGPATALAQNYVNPQNIKNVLVSQTLTLTLSVGFDKYDPAFGASKVWLGNLIVGSGAFKGWTVKALLDEANKVLGGCPSKYTPSEINDVISKINENFVDGSKSNGFLVKCDGIVVPQ